MTRQEMFNRAYQGVMGQGALAMRSPSLGCSYRTASGYRCAASWLLNDAQLDKVIAAGMNGCAARSIAKDMPGIFPDDIDFVDRLQSAHDGADDMADFETRMRNLAAREGLEVSA